MIKLNYSTHDYIPPEAFTEILKVKNPIVHIDKKQTGNGGTTAFLHYLINHNLSGALILPNQATALLKATEWSMREDINIKLIYGGTPLKCPKRDTEASLSIYVANSFNAEDITDKYDIILVDEYHKLVIDSDFREIFCYLDIKLHRWSNKARVLTISATPLEPCDVVIETKPRTKLPPITHHQIVKLPNTCLDDIKNGENVLVFINKGDWMRSLINQIPESMKDEISILTGQTIRRKSMNYYLPENNIFLKKHDPTKRIQIVSSAGIEGWDCPNEDVKIYMVWKQDSNEHALTIACFKQFLGRVRGKIKSIDVSYKGEYSKSNASWEVSKILNTKSDLTPHELIKAGDELTKYLCRSRNSMSMYQHDFQHLDVQLDNKIYQTRSSNRYKKQMGKMVYSTANKHKRYIALTQFHLNDFEVNTVRNLNPKDYLVNKRSKPEGGTKTDTFRLYADPRLDHDHHWHLETTFEHYNPLDEIGQLVKASDLFESKLVNGKPVFQDKYKYLIADTQSNIKTKMDFLITLDDHGLDQEISTLSDKKSCVGILPSIMGTLVLDKKTVIKPRLAKYSKNIKALKRQLKAKSITKPQKNKLSLEIKKIKEDREKLKDHFPRMILKGLLHLLDLHKGHVSQNGYRYYNAITPLGGDICSRIKDDVNNELQATYLVSSDLNQIAYKIMLAFTRTPFNPFSDVYNLSKSKREDVKVMVSKLPNSIKNYDSDSSDQRKYRKKNILDSMVKLGINRKNASKFYEFILANNGDKSNFWHYLYTGFEFQMLKCLEESIGKRGSRLHDEIYFVGSFEIPDIKFNIYVDDVELCSYHNWFTGTKSDIEYDLIFNTTTGNIVRKSVPITDRLMVNSAA